MDEENQVENALIEIKKELGSSNLSLLIDAYIDNGLNGVEEKTKSIVNEIVENES